MGNCVSASTSNAVHVVNDASIGHPAAQAFAVQASPIVEDRAYHSVRQRPICSATADVARTSGRSSSSVDLRSKGQKHIFFFSSSISDIILNSSDDAWRACETAPEYILMDIRLTKVLAQGGQGCVFVGTWHGADHVAVKIVATRGDDAMVYKAHAFQEVVFSKRLSHPHIVRTHDVRTCTMTQYFFNQHVTPGSTTVLNVAAPPAATAVEMRQQQTEPEVGREQAGGQNEAAAAAAATAPDVAATVGDAGVGNADGGKQDPHMPVGPQDVSMDQAFESADGFGRNDLQDKAEALSWAEIIKVTRMEAGDHVAVIVMDLGSVGNLWGAITLGVFGGEYGNGNASAAQAQASFRRRENPAWIPVRERALLRTAYEISMALHYLHVQGVVHGDIKPLNVLLMGSRLDKRGFTPVLVDFGLARIAQRPAKEQGGGKETHAEGTIQYMAPEVHTHQMYSPASDIYAFGILLYEMASGQAAYRDFNHRAQVVMGVTQWGLRPEWPAKRLPELGQLYRRCVAQDPSQRPTAEELVLLLKRMEMRVRYVSFHSRQWAEQ